jgi:hypothetical protein
MHSRGGGQYADGVPGLCSSSPLRRRRHRQIHTSLPRTFTDDQATKEKLMSQLDAFRAGEQVFYDHVVA